jgi:hypothetical protein
VAESWSISSWLVGLAGLHQLVKQVALAVVQAE